MSVVYTIDSLPEAIQKLDYFLKKYKVRKIFMVRGHHSYKINGAAKMVDMLVTNGNFQITDFWDFSANPKKEDVDKGVAIFHQVAPDAIIAIGGGSVIDMAKLIKFYAGGTIMPLVAIPTTSGTGAESTKFAVCYIDGVKYSICDDSILPNFVLLISKLTFGNSKYLTACTGFDALAQAIEAYWNIKATKESDELALKAIEYIYKPLLDIIQENQDEGRARKSLMSGANLAGQAINYTRTTMPHAMSYTLTSKYKYPHGHAVALTFPYFFDYYVKVTSQNYMGKDFQNFVAKMHYLQNVLGVNKVPFVWFKEYLNKLGLTFDPQRDFDNEVVEKGINLERAKNSPCCVDENIIHEAVLSIRK